MFYQKKNREKYMYIIILGTRFIVISQFVFAPVSYGGTVMVSNQTALNHTPTIFQKGIVIMEWKINAIVMSSFNSNTQMQIQTTHIDRLENLYKSTFIVHYYYTFTSTSMSFIFRKTFTIQRTMPFFICQILNYFCM